MTPWAELLLDPARADDRAVRARFHKLSRAQHPDRDGAAGKPGPQWYALTAAYQAINTAERRAVWAARQSHLASLCEGCRASGVQIRLTGREKGVRVCTVCSGTGRSVAL